MILGKIGKTAAKDDQLPEKLSITLRISKRNIDYMLVLKKYFSAFLYCTEYGVPEPYLKTLQPLDLLILIRKSVKTCYVVIFTDYQPLNFQCHDISVCDGNSQPYSLVNKTLNSKFPA